MAIENINIGDVVECIHDSGIAKYEGILNGHFYKVIKKVSDQIIIVENGFGYFAGRFRKST